MHITRRARQFVRGLMKSYGPPSVKKRLWDEEFSGTHWDFIDNTSGDCVYPHLEKYAANGSVLDLGCGPGNTANEMNVACYQTYVGVDISQEALNKATRRTQRNGRAGKNSFEVGDFVSYVPRHKFDIILFRESMYHVPIGKVKTTLDRYSAYLKHNGVFIVRVVVGESTINSTRAKLDVMEAEFDVVEKHEYEQTGPTVLIFRPKRRPAS